MAILAVHRRTQKAVRRRRVQFYERVGLVRTIQSLNPSTGTRIELNLQLGFCSSAASTTFISAAGINFVSPLANSSLCLECGALCKVHHRMARTGNNVKTAMDEGRQLKSAGASQLTTQKDTTRVKVNDKER